MLLHKVWLEPICHKYGRNVKSKELRRWDAGLIWLEEAEDMTKKAKPKKAPSVKITTKQLRADLAKCEAEITRLTAELECQPERVLDDLRSRFSNLAHLGLSRDASEICIAMHIGGVLMQKFRSFDMLIQDLYADAESYMSVNLQADMTQEKAFQLAMLRSSMLHHAERIDKVLASSRIEARGRKLTVAGEPLKMDGSKPDRVLNPAATNANGRMFYRERSIL